MKNEELKKILSMQELFKKDGTLNVGSLKFLKQDIVKNTQFLIGKTFNERVYCILNDITSSPKCKMCSNEVKFINFRKGYRKYCSPKCSHSTETILKCKKTKQERYGTSNTSELEWVKKKIKKTSLDRYGDGNFNNREKAKNTMLSRYGFEHYNQTEKYHNEREQQNYQKYGVRHYS